MASQDECKLYVWTRECASWSCKTFREGDVAELDAIGAQLDVSRLYEASSEPTG